MKRIFKSYQLYVGPVFLCLLFFAGYSISQKSWDGEIFIPLRHTDFPSVNSVRNIASVKTAVVKREALKQERQQTLVRSAKVENQKDKIKFYLGHFVVKSKAGARVLVCREYQTVDMTFIAGGVSVHGHVPKMILKAKCQFNINQPLQIGPFFIPKAEILKSSVWKQLFRSEDATIMFSHVSIRWPDKWILSEARFIKDSSKKDLKLVFSSNKEEDFLTLNLR